MQKFLNRRFGLGILFALPLLLAMLLPRATPSTKAAGGWSATQRVSEATVNSFFPDIAYDTTGVAHAVFSRTTDFNSRQVFYRRRVGTTWQQLKRDLFPALFYADRPRVYTTTVDGQVRVAIVVKGSGTSSSPNDSTIYYIESLDGGLTWPTPAKKISPTSSNEPDVVLDDTGTPHVVFSRLDPTLDPDGNRYLHIFYVTRDENGIWTKVPVKISKNATTGVNISTKYNNYATIEYTRSPEGVLSLHVLFMGEDKPGGELLKSIYYARNTNGSWFTPKRRATNSADQPDLESDHVSTVFGTWHSFVNTSTQPWQWEPYVGTSTDGGLTWGAPKAVGYKNGDWGVRPGIGRSVSGDLVVVYDSNLDSSNLNTTAAYKPNGLTWKPAVSVSIQQGLAKEAEVAGGLTEFGAVWHEIPDTIMTIYFSWRVASSPAATATATSTATNTATTEPTPTDTVQPTDTSTPTRTRTPSPTTEATATATATNTATPTASPTNEPGAVGAVPNIDGGAERTNNVTDLEVQFSGVQGSPTELRYAWGTAPTDNTWEPFSNPFTLTSYPSGLSSSSCTSKTLFTQVRNSETSQPNAASDSIVFDTGVQSAVTILNPLGEGAPSMPGGGNFVDYPRGAGELDYLRGLSYVYKVGEEISGCAGVASFDTLNNIETVRGSADVNKNFWVSFSPEGMGLTAEGNGYNEADIVASIRVTDTLDNVQVFTKTMHFDDDPPVLSSGTLTVGDQTGVSSTATITISASVTDSSYGNYPGIASNKAYWGIWVLVLNEDANDVMGGQSSSDIPGSPGGAHFAAYGGRVIPLGQSEPTIQLNLTDSSTSTNGTASGKRFVFVRFLDGAGNFSGTMLKDVAMFTAQ